MELNDISTDKTYFGKPDYKRGFGDHRTVLSIQNNLISFRNEVGKNPPACYVSLANMDPEEFAAWADKEVPTPQQAKDITSK